MQDKPVPKIVGWVMRLVLWPIALFIVFLGFLFYSSMRLGHHVEACLLKRLPVDFGSAGAALPATQALAACMRERSGWLERPALYFQARSIASPPPAPCYYVGRWKATRPGTVYEVTLRADHRFIAKPVEDPRAEGDIGGAWIGEGRKLTWMYDNGPLVWPPERNPVVEPAAEAFTIVEKGGGLTRYELLERIPAEGCDPGNGPR